MGSLRSVVGVFASTAAGKRMFATLALHGLGQPFQFSLRMLHAEPARPQGVCGLIAECPARVLYAALDSDRLGVADWFCGSTNFLLSEVVLRSAVFLRNEVVDCSSLPFRAIHCKPHRSMAGTGRARQIGFGRHAVLLA
jgi:hypothetical protein